MSLSYKDSFKIDIFFHEDSEKYSKAGCVAGSESVMWQFTTFDLVPFDIFGTTLLIPENPERYLTEIYGDWKVPDPDFDSVVWGKNLVEEYNPLIQCFTYQKLYICLDNTHKHKKARAYCKKIREFEPDNNFVADAEAFLDKCVESADEVG
jgi:hypothetical protein